MHMSVENANDRDANIAAPSNIAADGVVAGLLLIVTVIAVCIIVALYKKM